MKYFYVFYNLIQLFRRPFRSFPIFRSLHTEAALLVQRSLPLATVVGHRELVDGSLCPGSQLAHHVLYVEDKRQLAEVGVHDLAGCLQADRRVQVRLWVGSFQFKGQYLCRCVNGERECSRETTFWQPASPHYQSPHYDDGGIGIIM